VKSLLYIAIIAITITFASSCKNTVTYNKYVKELDSLKIVLQQAVANFKTIDSLTCLKAYSKQYTYSQFITTHLNDTVNKLVAQKLQTFQSVQSGFNDYIAMRSTWLNNAELSIEQLQTLTHDLKNGSLNEEEAVEFINEEKKQAEKIIEELKTNTETMRQHLELFNQSLPACEELIKQLNEGTLPQLITPEIKHPTEIN
jgi:polyhydroxyalkanoate synthesis regulator phasin